MLNYGNVCNKHSLTCAKLNIDGTKETCSVNWRVFNCSVLAFIIGTEDRVIEKADTVAV